MAKAKTAPPAPPPPPVRSQPAPAPAAKPAGANGSFAAAKPAAAPAAKPAVSRDAIAKRAYEIWESRGRPVGRDQENWREAERQLGLRA